MLVHEKIEFGGAIHLHTSYNLQNNLNLRGRTTYFDPKSVLGYLTGACRRGGGRRQALLVTQDDELELNAANDDKLYSSPRTMSSSLTRRTTASFYVAS